MSTILRMVSFWIAVLLQHLCLAQQPAPAPAWPSKPVHFVVPYAPGGPTDLVARMVGQKLSEGFGQQVVVENRTGAGGNIGTAAVAKSAPDGYTVLVTVQSIVINVSLYPDAGYDAVRDFIPVVIVARQPSVIVVNASFPARTLAELFSIAKTSKLAYASPGSGTPSHLTEETLFNLQAKLDMTAVHFRGAGPAVAAVLAGEPPVGATSAVAPLPHILSGKLRPLAVSGAKRITALSEVPTLTELGFPSLQDYVWVGVFVPAGTPSAIVQRLNELINHAVQSADTRERLEAQALELVGGSPQETAAYVRAELTKWGKVIREAGVKPD